MVRAFRFPAIWAFAVAGSGQAIVGASHVASRSGHFLLGNRHFLVSLHSAAASQTWRTFSESYGRQQITLPARAANILISSRVTS